MNKSSLATQLSKAYAPILEMANTITEDHFNFKPSKNRWTAGQQLQHLIISTQVFNKAIRTPKSILQKKFGLNEEPQRDYEKIVEQYQMKLKEGGTAPSKYAPSILDFSNKSSIVIGLQKELGHLLSGLEEWSEEDLDRYVLPHPLLGMLSIRELFSFNIYHTKHHTKILQEEYLEHA
ncbi:MAG: DinB family protein [Bacteroidota bacterium]